VYWLYEYNQTLVQAGVVNVKSFVYVSDVVHKLQIVQDILVQLEKFIDWFVQILAYQVMVAEICILTSKELLFV